MVDKAMHLPLLWRKAEEYLTDLERQLGDRDQSYEFVRICPSVTDSPHITDPVRSNKLAVCLTSKALSQPSPLLAQWQLAHECVHLIAPHSLPTNSLEEGIGVWYQNTKVTGRFRDKQGRYAVAEGLVTPHMPKLMEAIKVIRQVEGVKIGDVCPTVLKQYADDLSWSEARALCARFPQA